MARISAWPLRNSETPRLIFLCLIFVAEVCASVPSAPAITALSQGASAQLICTFSPGADGGSTITGFVVKTTSNEYASFGISSPIAINNLQIGQSFGFVMIARNADGWSAPSSVFWSPAVGMPFFHFGFIVVARELTIFHRFRLFFFHDFLTLPIFSRGRSVAAVDFRRCAWE